MKSTDFKFPCSLSDLTISSNEDFQVTSVVDIELVSGNDLIEDISSIGQSNTPILDQNVLNNMYSLIINFSSVSNDVKNDFMESFIDTTNSLYKHLTAGNITDDSITSCKKFSFMLAAIAQRFFSINLSNDMVENAKSRNKSNKSTKNKKSNNQLFDIKLYESNIVVMLYKYITLDPSILWSMSCVDTNYVVMFLQAIIQILSTNTINSIDKTIKTNCIQIISYCINLSSENNITTIASIIINNLLNYEIISHLVTPLLLSTNQCTFTSDVQLVNRPMKQLTNELFNELSVINMSQLTSNNYKFIAIFLDDYSKNASKSMISYLSIILKLLDSQVHQIRSAIIGVIGNIIVYINHTLSSSSVEIQPINQERDNESNNEIEESSSSDNNINENQLFNLRNSLYNILIERTHDNNYYTRANVLKTISLIIESSNTFQSVNISIDINNFEIIENISDLSNEVNTLETNLLDIQRFISILEVAIDRIVDKTSIVRKVAIGLIISLITNNPYTPNFNIITYTKINQNLEKILDEIQKKIDIKLKNELDGNLEIDEDKNSDGIEKNIVPFTMNESINYEGLHKYLSLYYQINSNIINIINLFHTSMKQLCNYLYSKNNTDIIETIRLFKSIIHFNAIDSAIYFRKSFQLIWHNDQSVRKEVIQSFFDVFLSDGSNNDIEKPSTTNSLPMNEIIYNIIELLNRCNNVNPIKNNDIKSDNEIYNKNNETTNSKTIVNSIEKILYYLFSESYINFDDLITTLWNHIYNNIQLNEINYDYKSLSSYCQLLSMLSKIAISSNLCNINDVLPINKLTLLLSYIYKANDTITCINNDDYFNTLRYLSMCLQYLPIDHTKEMNGQISSFLELLIKGLSDLVLGNFCNNKYDDLRKWFCVCEESIIAIYNIHPCPDKLMTTIFFRLHHSCQSNPSNKYLFIRFVYVLGQVVSSTLLYTERIAIRVKNCKIDNSSDDKKDNKIDKSNDTREDNIEDEMGLSISHDVEHERIYTNIIEYQLVLNNLLSNYYPMISSIILSNLSCKTKSMDDLSQLLNEVSLTSQSLCEKYLPVLFTILSNESNINIRISGMITIGDLAFRYPNTVEPWTDRIYARLYDIDPLVRYNSLLILSHLIFHDMIKVKSHISYLSMLLSDSNQTISDLATNFFTKLNERIPNPLLNYLGDVIGSLTYDMCVSSDKIDNASDLSIQKDMDIDNFINKRILTIDEFESTMNYLLSFIKKDKFADSLLERLLIRIQSSTLPNQKRLISYCLKDLSITEKGVKKLLDMIRQMKEILYDSVIFNNIKYLVTKLKKSNRLSPNGNSKSTTNDNVESSEESNQTIVSSSQPITSSNNSNTSVKSILNEIESLLEVIYNESLGIETTVESSNDSENISNNELNGIKDDKENDNITKLKSTKSEKKTKSKVLKTVTKKSKKLTRTKVIESDNDDIVDDDAESEVFSDNDIDVKSTIQTTRKQRKPLNDLTNYDD